MCAWQAVWIQFNGDIYWIINMWIVVVCLFVCLFVKNSGRRERLERRKLIKRMAWAISIDERVDNNRRKLFGREKRRIW